MHDAGYFKPIFTNPETGISEILIYCNENCSICRGKLKSQSFYFDFIIDIFMPFSLDSK